MKRILLFLLLIIFVSLVKAQNFSIADRTEISVNIDSLLSGYLQKSNLRLPGVNKLNPKVINDLQDLFTVDAEIFDDINANFNESKGKYELKIKSGTEYIEDLVESFPKGLIIDNKNFNVNYAGFERGEVTAAVARRVEGTNNLKYTFYNDDTLLIRVKIFPDKSVKIVGIENIGSNIVCRNDDDVDGVIDSLDVCRGQKGVIALGGCPDDDLDGIANKNDDCPDQSGPASNNGCPPSTFAYQYVFTCGAGYQMNKNSISVNPEESIGYVNHEEDFYQDQDPKVVSPGYTGSICLNANIAYYFGKNRNNRNKGISVGVYATNYSARYDIKDFKYVYNPTDQSGQSYQRIITLQEGYEDLSFTILNIPLMFRYKKKIGSNWAVEIGGGVSLLSFITNMKESSKATFNYEGKYSTIDGSSVNWIIVNDTMQNQMFYSSQSANAHFNGLNAAGYDFALDKEKSPNTGTFARFKVGFNAIADAFYHIGPKTAIRAGFTLIYSPSEESNPDYKMTEATDDNYNSVYRSNITTIYNSFGFNMGIIIGI